MLKIKVKSTFKKDLKRASKNPRCDIDLLKKLIDCLTESGTVPPKHVPHRLVGNWKPHMECHIQPDFLLIWDIDTAKNELVLVRCGSHSELFG